MSLIVTLTLNLTVCVLTAVDVLILHTPSDSEISTTGVEALAAFLKK